MLRDTLETSADRRSLPDSLLAVLYVFGASALCLMTYATVHYAPAEDAVILHQYSRNLTETGVISYIPGGAAAEGATDFLWMLYIALALKLHLSPAVSTALANAVSAVGIAYILLRLAHRRFRWSYAFAIVGLLALLPQILAAAVGFSVLPFGLAIAATAMLAEEGKDRPAAVAALLLCLLRPDGVLFAIPILLRRISLTQPPRRTLIRQYLVFFVLPGLVYFVWRWFYFRHFFPLPFLVKADTKRVFGIFSEGHALLRYLLFDGVVILATLGKRVLHRRELSLLLALLVIPSLFYSGMRLDQNAFGRFYFYVPLVAALVVAMYWDATTWGRRPLAIILGLAMLACFTDQDLAGIRKYPALSKYWRGNEAIARDLSVPRLHGTLLTSEAGDFAYFSRWTTYDSWGLNTPAYAAHLIRPDDVVRLAPNVIVVHLPSCSIRASPVQTQRTFGNMFSNIQTGIAMMGIYNTWRQTLPPVAPNEPEEVLCWYVANNYPQRTEVEAILARHGAVQLSGSQALSQATLPQNTRTTLLTASSMSR